MTEHKFKRGDMIKINGEKCVYKLFTLPGQSRYILADPFDGIGCTIEGATFNQIAAACPFPLNTLTNVNTDITYTPRRKYKNGALFKISDETYKLLIFKNNCGYYAIMLNTCNTYPLSNEMIKVYNEDYINERELRSIIGGREFEVIE